MASALSWTPTGGLLVGSLRGRISLLDGDTGRLLASGDTALGAIRRIVPAPDGRTAAVVGTEGELAIWQLDAAAVVAELPSSPSVGVAFDTDGLVVHRADALQSWRLPRSGPPSSTPPRGSPRWWRRRRAPGWSRWAAGEP